MNNLINNVDKIHTTELGIKRIINNISINNVDVIAWCKKIIINKDSKIVRTGKNYYVYNGKYVLTINAYSYTIITGHIIKE